MRLTESSVPTHGWTRVLDIQHNRVINRLTGSVLEILSADVHSSYGLLLDFLLIDEITNWHDSGEKLWDALFSTVAKRKSCLCVIISNAGVGYGHELAVEDSRSRTNEYAMAFLSPRRTPSFMDRSRPLAGAAATAPESRVPAALAQRMDDRCRRRPRNRGKSMPLSPPSCRFCRVPREGGRTRRGWTCPSSRDHSVLAIVGKRRSDERYRLVLLRVWRPGTQRKIDQEAVEEAILSANKRFRLRNVAVDPFQAEYLVSRLKKAKVPVEVRAADWQATRGAGGNAD